MITVIGNGNDGWGKSVSYLCCCYYASYVWNSDPVLITHVRNKTGYRVVLVLLALARLEKTMSSLLLDKALS